ncbi:MAG TPA: hypothetical protein VI758_08070, partial [Bacteroidota bacterium]
MKPAFTVKRDYGAAELKRVYRKNMLLGLGISLVINLIVVGSYWKISFEEPQRETPTREVRITKYEEIGVPPSVTGTTFGLSAYPTLEQSPKGGEKKTGIPHVRPGPIARRQKYFAAARGLEGIQGALP